MSFTELPKVRNNSIIIFSAQIISLFLNIVSVSLAARYLGVKEFGSFNYLLAIVGVGAKVLDFGFNPIIFRELSKEKNSQKYLGSVLIFRILCILLTISLFGIIGFMVSFDTLKLTLILVLSINVLFSNKFTNIRELIIIPFKVDLKLHIPMMVLILDNILLLVLVSLTPFFNGGILYFVIVYVVSNIPGMLILYYYLLRNYEFKYTFNVVDIKYLFNESLPLIGFIIFSFLYTILDILLLENISGSTSVGIYSSAIRLIVPLKLIPNVFVITLFSIIVKNIDNEKYNQQITNFVAKLFFLFSTIFFATMIIGSEEIILIIFGQKYIDASLPLKILSFGIFFDFFSFFILDLFTAYNKQKYNFQFILLVIISMLISNIILIPSHDFIGASIARVLSGIIGFAFLLIILNKHIKLKMYFVNVSLIISIICFFVSIYFFSELYPLINIFISTMIFLFVIVLFKVFTKHEMKILIQLIGNNINFRILKKYYKIKD